MTFEASFFVPGVPKPQGSKNAYAPKHGGRVRLVEAVKGVREWRAVVAAAAQVQALRGGRFDGPVSVTLNFLLPRPAHPKFSSPAVKPDLDKLCRALLDGLVDGGLLRDDSRVVRLQASKRYAQSADESGAQVVVRGMS